MSTNEKRDFKEECFFVQTNHPWYVVIYVVSKVKYSHDEMQVMMVVDVVFSIDSHNLEGLIKQIKTM